MQAGGRSWFPRVLLPRGIEKWAVAGTEADGQEKGQLVSGEKADTCPWAGEWGGGFTPRQRAGLGDRKAGVVVTGGEVR